MINVSDNDNVTVSLLRLNKKSWKIHREVTAVAVVIIVELVAVVRVLVIVFVSCRQKTQ